MKKIIIISTTLLSLIQTVSLGQTEMLNSQYLFEKTFITPANFQQEEKLRVFMNHQSSTGQGRGGKEYIYSAAANYKANEKSLVGINVVSNQFGQENSLMGYMNYTYNILIAENATLSNGIGFGFQQYRLNLDDAQGGTVIDPTVTGNIYSSKFDFRLGATALINKKTYFGVSFDNILSNYNNQSEKEVNYTPASFRRINMTFMAGNSHRLDRDFDVHYEGLYTYNFGGVSNIDLNARLIFGDILGGGLAYRRYMRSEENQVLSYGVIRPFLTLDLSKNSNKFRFNYAYGFAPNKTNTVGLTTHEFGFTYGLRN